MNDLTTNGAQPDVSLLLRQAKTVLRQMTEHLDFTGPLPTPTEWTTPGTDNVPGALWRMGWKFRTRYCDVPGRVEVIVAADDAGSDRPSVFIRGLDIGNDIDSMSTEQARELGRALLAAADMAGSDVVAARCRVQRRPERPPRRRPRPSPAVDEPGFDLSDAPEGNDA